METSTQEKECVSVTSTNAMTSNGSIDSQIYNSFEAQAIMPESIESDSQKLGFSSPKTPIEDAHFEEVIDINSNTNKKKSVIEVGITRPKERESSDFGLSKLKESFKQNDFNSLVKTYTVDTGLPVTISMKEAAFKTTERVPRWKKQYNFTVEKGIKKLEFSILSEYVFYVDGEVSITYDGKSKFEKNLFGIFEEYVSKKTLEDAIEAVGEGKIETDDPKYKEWQPKIEAAQRKQDKEYADALRELAHKPLHDLLKQHLDDVDHVAALESSIAIANEYEKAKQKSLTSFMGIELPDGYFQHRQHLKVQGTEESEDDHEDPTASMKKKKSSKNTGGLHLGNMTVVTEIAHNDDEIDEAKVITCTSRSLKEIWVAESDLKNRTGLMALSKKGCSFNESAIKDTINYFIKLLEDEKNQIKHTFITHRNGWKDDFKTFVVGNTTITCIKNGDDFKHYQFADKRIAQNLEPNGDIETWVEAINHVICYELIQGKFMAGCGSPLIELLGIEPFIFNSRMKSGKGKTFSDSVVNTCVCDPIGDKRNRLVVTGYSTKVGLEQYFVAFNSLPYNIDEASLIEAQGKNKKDFISTIIYLFTSGLDKLRGNVDGKNREQNIFHGVLRMNGENDLSGDDANTGEKARVINCSMRIPYDEDSIRRVTDYKWIMTMYNPHSTFFPLYIKKIIEDTRDEAIRRFVEYRDYFTVEGVDGNAQRMAQDFAVLALAGYYINEVFKDIGVQTFDYMKVVKKIFDSHMTEGMTEEQDITALRKLMSWFGGNHKHFNEPADIPNTVEGQTQYREDKRTYLGFHRNGEIQIFKEEFLKIMDKLGYDNAKANSILRYWWKERDILVPHTNGEAACGRVKVQGIYIPTVRIKEEAVNALLNPDHDDEEEVESESEELDRMTQFELAKKKVEAEKLQFYRESTDDKLVYSWMPPHILEYVENHKSTYQSWLLAKQIREITG